jgi:hypothetical protein
VAGTVTVDVKAVVSPGAVDVNTEVIIIVFVTKPLVPGGTFVVEAGVAGSPLVTTGTGFDGKKGDCGRDDTG